MTSVRGWWHRGRETGKSLRSQAEPALIVNRFQMVKDGPDSIARRRRSLLDPSKEIKEGYEAYSIALKTGGS